MLAKAYRLTLQTDFAKVKRNGRNFSSKNFTLSVYKRAEGDHPRFGIIVPNKVLPKSTDRNRVKRVISEGIRFQLTYVSPLYDCVFLPRESILRAYTADVIAEVAEAFKNAKITKDLQK